MISLFTGQNQFAIKYTHILCVRTALTTCLYQYSILVAYPLNVKDHMWNQSLENFHCIEFEFYNYYFFQSYDNFDRKSSF